MVFHWPVTCDHVQAAGFVHFSHLLTIECLEIPQVLILIHNMLTHNVTEDSSLPCSPNTSFVLLAIPNRVLVGPSL